MSDETKTALDEALEAHLRDECDGAIVTGYALHASYVNPESDERMATGYFAEYPTNQPRHVAVGLVQMHLTYLLSSVVEVESDDE